MTDDIVARLRDQEEFGLLGVPGDHRCVSWGDAADEIERLRAALRPFAKLFMYPDDLGFEAALDIREDPDWDEDANDMQSENCFVLRRDIKAARAALAGEKTND